jgi:paraquat-inducible protein B
MIGAFVVGALSLVVIGIVIFGSGKFFTERSTFVVYFDGSLKGLNIGAPVVFRGAKIGSVTNIVLRANPEDLSIQIPVFIEIEPDRFERVGGGPRKRKTEEAVKLLIDRGLRAQLEMQSLVTGQLMVALDFHPDKPKKMAGDGRVPEIPTIPTTFEQLAEKLKKAPVEEIIDNIHAAVEGIEKIVNSPEAMRTVQSMSKAVKNIDNLVKTIDKQVQPLTSRVNDTLDDYRRLAIEITGHVDPLAASVRETVQDTKNLVGKIDGKVGTLASSVEKTVEAASAAIMQARKTLVSVENVTSEDSVVTYQVVSALKELTAAARSLRVLTEYLERHPEALIRGKNGPGGK